MASATPSPKKFSQAYDAYTSLISYGNDSEEIHLGILKAQAKIADTDELFEYYKSCNRFL